MSHAACAHNAGKLTEILKKILRQVNPMACRVVRTWQDSCEIDNDLLEIKLAAALSLEPICAEDLGLAWLLKGAVNNCRRVLQCQRQQGLQPGKQPWPEEFLKKEEAEEDALSELTNGKRVQARNSDEGGP